MRGGAQPVDSTTRIEAGSTAGSVGKDSQRADTPPLRTVAFEEFKKERGSEINRILNENKGKLMLLHHWLSLCWWSENYCYAFKML